MRALSAAFGLPPDLDVAGHPGSGRSAWRLVSPSTGDEWHFRIAEPNSAAGFLAGRDLTRKAGMAGLGIAQPLAVRDGDGAEPSFDPATIVLRRWLEGSSLESNSTTQDLGVGDRIGGLLAGLHQLWPFSRTDDDALDRWYGVFPRTRWERWFNEAENAALPWTALAPSALPVLAEATSLVKAGLATRGLTPVLTHRQVEPRHVVSGIDGFTLIDPFSAGPDLPWLEVIDVAVFFPGPVIDAYARSGGTVGPSIVEATCRRYGREMHRLACDMRESLACPPDEETVEIAFASIQARIDRLTAMVERIESRASAAFG